MQRVCVTLALPDSLEHAQATCNQNQFKTGARLQTTQYHALANCTETCERVNKYNVTSRSLLCCRAVSNICVVVLSVLLCVDPLGVLGVFSPTALVFFYMNGNFDTFVAPPCNSFILVACFLKEHACCLQRQAERKFVLEWAF